MDENDYFEWEEQNPEDKDVPTEDAIVTALRERIATLEALLSRSYDQLARPDTDLAVHFELLGDIDAAIRAAETF